MKAHELPQDSFKESLLQAACGRLPGKHVPHLKGKERNPLATSYLLGFPMNSLHLSPLWNVLVNELIYEHSQNPHDNKEKESRGS